MKKIIAPTIAILLLIIVNTQYYWGQIISFDATVLAVWSISLLFILLFIHLLRLVKRAYESDYRKGKIIRASIISFCLFVVALFPDGAINYEKHFHGATIMHLQSPSWPKTWYEIDLKEDGVFFARVYSLRELRDCGNYYTSNDTVFLRFNSLELNGPKYEYVVIGTECTQAEFKQFETANSQTKCATAYANYAKDAANIPIEFMILKNKIFVK